ncbi:MAG: tRNA dihydrouridine synthase DusB [Firmicutes bacterium]|nr:tRNA dihydrouridine synthase DusB [Bacillota bacterium]
MFKIGAVEIANQVILAPMAGVTDRAFRSIAKSFGCGLVVTEMISDMGLIYGQSRTQRIADTSGETRPVAVQIFGSDPDSMGRAARIVQELGADIIDINMGCPTPKIVRNGEGAALMQDIPRCREIIRAVVGAVRVPVTVKMRSGWDHEHITCVELASVAQEEGAAALILHPRTRMQFFAGVSDWTLIKKVKAQVQIPVIGNGDIHSPQDAGRMLAETGCDAVMIGRAALGNPFIISATLEYLRSGQLQDPPSREERIETARRHLQLAIACKGEWVAVREMRKQLAWYIKGRPGAAHIRTQLNTATSLDQILTILQS